MTGSITAEGEINLGDSNLDSVNFVADVSSSIIPDATDTYNLGQNHAKRWKTVFAQTGSFERISGSVEFSDTLTVNGCFDIYDFNQNKLDRPLEELFVKGAQIQALVKCSGIWIVGGKFGCSWNVSQIMVDAPATMQSYAFIDDSDGEEDEDDCRIRNVLLQRANVL